MKKKELTRWFRIRNKPVRPGVYQVRFTDDLFQRGLTGYAWWSGKKWGWFQSTAADARRLRNTNGADQKKEWRGYTTRQE